MNSTTIEKTCPAEKENIPALLMGIRVYNEPKSNLFNPGNLKLKVGLQVMVETDHGPKLGVVASNKIPNFRKCPSKEIRKVLRIANENDQQAQTRKLAIEEKSKAVCAEKIVEFKLPMNLSRVVHLPEQNKTVFYFTAEGRVDFRQLIRDLASRLKLRIEMKQVGVRDEARSITGYGVCGEELCCSRFLKEFTPVTIRMAKDQGLALNPSKISGVCGRLMCCLQYEHSNYQSLVQGLPKVHTRINTPEGPGKVIKNDILQQNTVVRLDDESIMTFHLNELKDYLKKSIPDNSSPSE